jgi:hypothetical protein
MHEVTAPTLWHLLRLLCHIKWQHWKNRRLSRANRRLTERLRHDHDLAESTTANFAVIILDGSAGRLTYPASRAIAQDLMSYLRNRSQP